MSDIGEALGAVGGLIFGGILLLLLAPTLNPVTTINLEGWGTGFFIIGTILAIITGIVAVGNLFNR